MPIRALGAVSKTDGRIIPEESMMVPESSLEAHYEALRGALVKLSCWLMVRRLADLVFGANCCNSYWQLKIGCEDVCVILENCC